MNTAKVYFDSNGKECSIWTMIRSEPDWAANRIQEGEKAIERVKLLEKAISICVREKSVREYENDKEAINGFVEWAEAADE